VLGKVLHEVRATPAGRGTVVLGTLEWSETRLVAVVAVSHVGVQRRLVAEVAVAQRALDRGWCVFGYVPWVRAIWSHRNGKGTWMKKQVRRRDAEKSVKN
jgi:hypothetical protein